MGQLKDYKLDQMMEKLRDRMEQLKDLMMGQLKDQKTEQFFHIANAQYCTAEEMHNYNHFGRRTHNLHHW